MSDFDTFKDVLCDTPVLPLSTSLVKPTQQLCQLDYNFVQHLFRMRDYIKYNVRVAFNNKVKSPIPCNTALPIVLGIFLSADGRVADILTEIHDLLIKSFLYRTWRFAIRSLKLRC